MRRDSHGGSSSMVTDRKGKENAMSTGLRWGICRLDTNGISCMVGRQKRLPLH